MPPARPPAPLPAGLTTLLLVAAVGLGCKQLTEGDSRVPSANQISELGRSFQDEVEAQVPSLTLQAPGSPPGVTLPGACPTVSNDTDGDGDGIRDDAFFTFTNPPCQITGFRGGTIALTGAVRVVDPSAANGTAYNLTLDDVTWQYTSPTASLSYTAVRSGTRNRTGSSSAIAVSSDLTTLRQRPVITAVAQIDLALDWAFNAAPASVIVVNQPLPDGEITVDGTVRWRRSTEDWNLAVGTITALEYDADCASPQRIVAGRVTLVGTVAGVPGTVRITWNECGTEPSRVWIPAP